MSIKFLSYLQEELASLKAGGLYKDERVITSPQQAKIVSQGQPVLNFCANNYLGLSNDDRLKMAAKRGVDKYGFGLSSVRFICGTQSVHKELESGLARFLGMDDAILYSSCFDANGGLFETLLGPEDAIISDALNHASIIDGIRLCKAQRYRYENNQMADLRQQLVAARGARYRLIATDGVFSMDGTIANLPAICDLAEEFDAMVMVDDSHAVGFMGKNGRGTIEHCGVEGRVHIVTGTLGKALGGASGGYTAGAKAVVDWLRQRSRPYLFSNTLAPMIAEASIEAIKMLSSEGELRARLHSNASKFRAGMTELGFKLVPGEHPIIPVMLGDAVLAQTMAAELFLEGIYVIGFSFPVVPKGQARIRTQISAAHSVADIDCALAAFAKVGKKLGVIK